MILLTRTIVQRKPPIRKSTCRNKLMELARTLQGPLDSKCTTWASELKLTRESTRINDLKIKIKNKTLTKRTREVSTPMRTSTSKSRWISRVARDIS